MSSSSSTSTSDTANAKDMEKAPVPFKAQKHDILFSESSRYLVLDFNGEGCFGQVAKCVNLKTAETVAIKIHKGSGSFIQREVDMLQAIRTLDPEKKNLVRFMDSFYFQGLSCLAFEMLDKSLWDLMKEREGMPLTLNEIRPVTHQLLVAFEALKSIGILHTDLKPDNIMLVNHKDQPFRVKLIDFGLALPVSKLKVGMKVQACGYRAPEVTLGLPISEAIDMWGLGCVIAFLYFGKNLFPGSCEYHRMKVISQLLGQPGDHLLGAGWNTRHYFSRQQDSINSGWRLNSPDEYNKATGVKPKISRWWLDRDKDLEETVKSSREKGDALEFEDRMTFLSLLKWLLHVDARRRVTPRQALKHTFITMAHLADYMDTSSYADTAIDHMTISPLNDSDESEDSVADIEEDTEPITDSSDDSSAHEDEDLGAFNYDYSNPAQETGLRRETASVITSITALTDEVSSSYSYVYEDDDFGAFYYDYSNPAQETGLRRETAPVITSITALTDEVSSSYSSVYEDDDLGAFYYDYSNPAQETGLRRETAPVSGGEFSYFEEDSVEDASYEDFYDMGSSIPGESDTFHVVGWHDFGANYPRYVTLHHFAQAPPRTGFMRESPTACLSEGDSNNDSPSDGISEIEISEDDDDD